MQDLTEKLKEGTYQELTKHILPWWQKRMLDPKNGGYHGRIDGHGKLIADAPKGAVLNARILWTFSSAALHLHLKNPLYLANAHEAYRYFSEYFIDKEQGGIYWMLNPQGKVISGRKQVYAQAFALYGLSEYYRVTGQEKVLAQAIGLFELMEKYGFDSQYGGYIEALDRNWQQLDDVRLSEKDENEQKSMNTNLHVLEAYTNLYRIWKSPHLAEQLEKLLEIFLQRIIHPNGCFSLFFDERWNVKSEKVSFGHDIEGSWLLCEAAELLGDEMLLTRVQKVAVKMARTALQEGMDIDGGLFNERIGNHLDDDKHWWPQAEAVVGSINAWQLTEEPFFLECALRAWAFVQSKMINREKGEWHFRVDRKGNPYLEENLAGPWKCPYHNARACLEAYHRL